MVIVQVELLPAGPHSPSQPENVKESSGVSVSVTCSPGAKVNVQLLGHEIPERWLVTLPPLVLIRTPCLLKFRISTVSVEPAGTVDVVVVPPGFVVVVEGGFGGFGGSSTSRACSEKRPHSRPGVKVRTPSSRFRTRAPGADMKNRPVATSSP